MNRAAISLVNLLALSLIFISAARAEVVTTETTGVGRSRPEAITQALVEAVQRVTGVRVDQSAATGLSQRILQVDADANRSGALSTIGLDFSGTARVSDGFDMVVSQSGGAVKTYTVLSSSIDSRGYTTVRLKVHIEKFRSVMPETANRIRIVVAAFQGLPPGHATQLQDRLKVYFVQARRFSVLDRSENAQYESEMDLVTSESANLSERVRFGQVLGADFILVGKATTTKRREEVLNPISMERSMRERVSAEITYSLIEIATRQIQWSNIVKVSSLESSHENTARLIGTQVSETLFPLRVVTIDDPSNLIINQGGQSVVAGERYRLVELGAEIKDPDTKESLGRRETDLGIIEITRVSQNLSSAKLISGNAKKSDHLILRRSEVEVKVAVPPPNPGTRSKAFD